MALSRMKLDDWEADNLPMGTDNKVAVAAFAAAKTAAKNTVDLNRKAWQSLRQPKGAAPVREARATMPGEVTPNVIRSTVPFTESAGTPAAAPVAPAPAAAPALPAARATGQAFGPPKPSILDALGLPPISETPNDFLRKSNLEAIQKETQERNTKAQTEWRKQQTKNDQERIDHTIATIKDQVKRLKTANTKGGEVMDKTIQKALRNWISEMIQDVPPERQQELTAP
jgi:hypothetical protein